MTVSLQSDEIEALVAEFKAAGMRELHVRCDAYELYLSSDPDAAGIGAAPAVPAARPAAAAIGVAAVAAPAPASAKGSPVTEAAEPADLPVGAVVVRAPYMGTFYRSPKPGAPVYVEIGARVTTETELCLVEVMKLFTAVRAPIAGRVHAVLAVDGQLVEGDQPLFVVTPA
jgi:acetyl-CoA carboxylase biotin carboxyl carrier protein